MQMKIPHNCFYVNLCPPSEISGLVGALLAAPAFRCCVSRRQNATAGVGHSEINDRKITRTDLHFYP